jgi:hypothetical protein
MSVQKAVRFAGLLLLMCGTCFANDFELTIYNQNFGVVREIVPLDLKKGTTEVRLADMTSNLEPDSVMLRDVKGRTPVQILEQSYRADPVSQGLLLSLFEGKTIDFLVEKNDKTEIVRGRIVRSGYSPDAVRNPQPYYGQPQIANAGDLPIIEIDGKLRFGLPGTPLFPSLTDQTVLKPTLSWLLQSDANGRVDGELSYVTAGLNWNAAYNVVAPETGDVLELVGWVTMQNQTGKNFENAHIKLMAGQVNKIQPRSITQSVAVFGSGFGGTFGGQPAVTEKPFDEYHLYELHQVTTLRDKETKQVEFTRADGIQSNRVYVYDGFKLDPRYNGWDPQGIRQNGEYGTQSNPSVWVMREFANTKENHLGIPLPAGRIRFYRRDADGHLEFTGENEIQHTPTDETLRVYEGTAFDLVGERRQTNYNLKQNGMNGSVDESFEIKLRNHAKGTTKVRVAEHLYRGLNWAIQAHSDDFVKKDSKTIEFEVPVEAGVEKTVTYSVHYTW